MEKAREHEEKGAAEEKARQDAEAQERAVREFELTQAGFDASRGGRAGAKRTDGLKREGSLQQSATPTVVPAVENGRTEKRGEKRKFSFNEDEVARIAEEERVKARKAIDDEKVRASTTTTWRTILTQYT